MKHLIQKIGRWVNFFQWFKGCGLDRVKLIVGDKCLGMLESVEEVFPDAKYQHYTVHFYRNIFSVVPRFKVKLDVEDDLCSRKQEGGGQC